MRVALFLDPGTVVEAVYRSRHQLASTMVGWRLLALRSRPDSLFDCVVGFIGSVCPLAAKAIRNLVSRMAAERSFIETCLKSGVVGGLCGAVRGATQLLEVVLEVR